MRFFITSSKDATIYSDNINQNTGIDQILEVRDWIKGDKVDTARSLVQFDFNEVSESISNGNITQPSFSLELTATELREIGIGFDLEVYPLSQSWEMGLGKRQDDPINTNGVSWKWRDYESGSAWNNTGSDYITSVSASKRYGKYTDDLIVDVTHIVNDFMSSGSYDNNGFIAKFSDSAENDSVQHGSVNFFSGETHTIYEPRVAVDYDDQSINIGNLSKVDTDNPFVTFTNLKTEYKKGNSYKFRLHSRKEFPELTFTTGSPYSVNHYLPTASKYSIVDNVTGDVIVPFGEHSKISVDPTGSYFNQRFDGWEAERYYRILIKIDDGDNTTEIIDKNFTFNLVE